MFYDNIKIKDSQTGQPITVKIDRPLGNGAFANVYLAIDARGKKYALKRIKPLYNQKLYYFLSNEVKVLKDLKMLNGIQPSTHHLYEYDLLMPYVRGEQLTTTYTRDLLTQKESIAAAFRAIRKLHKHGIMHNDTHSNNLIYCIENNTTEVIDFGLAEYNSGVVSFSDYIQLVSFIKTSRPQFFKQITGTDMTYYAALKLYAQAVIAEMQANKMQTAFNLFTYAAFSVSLIYGLATVQAVRLLTRYIMMHLLQTQILQMNMSALHRLRAQQMLYPSTVSPFDTMLRQLIIVASSTLSYIANIPVFKFAFKLSMALLTGNLNQVALQLLPIVDLIKVAILSMKLKTSKQFLEREHAYYCSSAKKFDRLCDSITTPKSWLPCFNMLQRNKQNQTNDGSSLSTTNAPTWRPGFA